MQSWFQKFTRAVFSNGLASVATLISGVLILRLLNNFEAGRFTLLYSTGSLVTILGTFGQVGLINRIYARSEVPFNWRRDYRNTALICLGLILTSDILFSLIYELTPAETTFVFLYAFSNALSNLSGAMLNSQRHYTWAGLLFRLQNALFIIPILMMWAGLLHATLPIALITLIITGFLCVCLGWYATERYMPNGKLIIHISERADSIGLNLIGLAHSVLDPGLIVVAGYFIRGIELAALGGIFTFFRPAILIWLTMIQSLSVEFARDKTFLKRKIFQSILFLSPVMVGVVWLTLPWLLQTIYAGKYDLIKSSSLPVALMIGLLILETIPRSYISGFANSSFLHVFSLWSILSAALFVGVEIILIRSFGVFGVAWAGVFALSLRNLLGYGMIIRGRRQLKQVG